MFDSAAEAEPRGQRDSADGLRGQIGEVKNDQAKASAFEQQVSRAQDLLETVFEAAPIFFLIQIFISGFLCDSVSPW